VSVDPSARPVPALRASDADREAVAERLRVASVDGRIEADELEERLSAVYAARWVADLDRLVADVSPPPPPAPMAPPYMPYAPAPVYQTTNGLAVASLIAGFFWLGWVGSILAVIFGHLALGQINRSGGREGGSGLAIAGLVLGYMGVATLLFVILAAVL
jgi:hypothetical protein